MVNAVVPRQQGDDYQARFFWLQVCRLFQPHSKVIRVGYELSVVKSFDDVVVYYSTPIPDERGKLIEADYYQIKFHVSHDGCFTCEALMDPAFIGASSVSLLQRLHAAHKSFASNGAASRFHIVAPWPVHPDDDLAKLISNQGGELRLHILLDGGPRSAMGRIREAWRNHLNISSDDELSQIIQLLRIRPNAETLDDLQDRLNDKLENAGFAPVPTGRFIHPYDDLIRKAHARGFKEFDQNQIRELCEREELWRGRDTLKEDAIQIGIRSFMRWAEHMEDETDQMLCLVHYFDNRHIKDTNSWQRLLLPELEKFLSNAVRKQQSYHLHLDAHASIAFATGYCLDVKSGTNVSPLQGTRFGKVLWKPLPNSDKAASTLWSYEEFTGPSQGNDVAIAIGITHDVLDDVRLYVSRALPDVKRIIGCTITPKPNPTAVANGTHALQLAQEISSILKKRSVEERQAVLHIFAAAPNGFLFFLGQLARSFGRCVMYEYDFNTNAPGAYQPSLAFPSPSSV